MAYISKEKQKIASKKFYDTHREEILKQVATRNEVTRERNKKFIIDYLNTHPCVDCNENDITVLEFDHVRGTKHMNLSDMTSRAYCIKTISEEIAKCEVRCANCHRKVTYQRRNNNH